MRPPRLAAGLLLALVGCQQDYLFQQVCPTKLAEVQLEQPAARPTPADILFIVDNSGSMADEQENLAQSFASFIDGLSADGGDYRLAVVTTDQGNGNSCQASTECGGLAIQEYADGPYRYRTGQDPSMCVVLPTEHGCFRGDPGDPVIAIDGSTSRDAVIQKFQETVRVGSCGSGSEQGLLAMRNALDLDADGGCNQGFLREEANLVVVVVSDEPDGSLIGGTTVDDYVDDLARIKGSLDRVRVAVIVGAVGGQPVDCRAGPDGSATAQCGSTVCDNPPESGSFQVCNNSGDCSGDEACRVLSAGPRCIDGMGGGSRVRCGGDGDCDGSAGESCQQVPQERRCVNPPAALLLDFPENCRSCTFFDVEGCCGSQPGSGYVEFAQRFGARALGREGLDDCIAAPGEETVCLIDAICQDDFSNTLNRIARELVSSDELVLDPPANPEFPEGVVVQVGTEGSFRTLEYEEDYRIEFRMVGDVVTRSTLRFEPNQAPAEGEELRVYYVTPQGPSPERPLRGACVDAGPVD